MKYCVGIDLGSTTTKAVILNEEGKILGRGITNSRSNYKVACDVAQGEALVSARFALLAEGLESSGVTGERKETLLERIKLGFLEQQYRSQLKALGEVIRKSIQGRPKNDAGLKLVGVIEAPGDPAALYDAVNGILTRMDEEASDLYSEGARRKSDFFRDLAGSRYLALAEEIAEQESVSFDRLAGMFDKAILDVENMPPSGEDFGTRAVLALGKLSDKESGVREALQSAAEIPLEKAAGVGTGYGRRTLPFEKDEIRSEILCHGLGAHSMFAGTRTVLDIGGQDTKAIQVDESGIVTSFQMNDRCAAGCGRYLGYIADEMNVGVHELGPMACKSTRSVRINSTCTVFAGAELRERLSLGEKREDILAGLHRAIILRAMSLLARSGGIEDEFTFTGGVANNTAAVAALEKLVQENYGAIRMNISPDSIYTGALGAALFAYRTWTKPKESTVEVAS